MKTSAFLNKTKVVELEILYNSSVNGAPDQLLHDGLCPKYFLTFFLLNFILMLWGALGPRNRLIDFLVGPGAQKCIFGAPGAPQGPQI